MPRILGLGRGLAFWRPVLNAAPSPSASIIAAIEATDAGPQSDPVKAAITTFVAALQSAGLWDAIYALYGMVGGTNSSHQINWKTPGTFDATLSGGITNNADGVIGDGISGKMATAITSFEGSCITIGVYARANAADPAHIMGAQGDTGADGAGFAANGQSFAAGVGFGGSLFPNVIGLMMIDYISGNNRLYFNGAEDSEVTALAINAPTNPLYFLSNTTGASAFCDANISLAVKMKQSLTAGQHANFYLAVEDLQLALNRSAIVKTIIDAIEATDAGAQSAPVKAAIADFVATLQNARIWSKMWAVYGFVGGTANSHAINWKTPGTYDITWSGTVTHNANGITGDGATGYGDTGIIPSAFDQNDWSQGVYSRTNSDAVMVDFSSAGGGYSRLALNIGGQAFFDQPDDVGGGGQNRQTNNNSSGLIHGSRVATNDSKIYRNGSSLGGIVTEGGATSTRELTLLAENNVPPTFYSNRNLALAFVASGLDATESSDLYTAVQAFQTALGRQV